MVTVEVVKGCENYGMQGGLGAKAWSSDWVANYKARVRKKVIEKRM